MKSKELYPHMIPGFTVECPTNGVQLFENEWEAENAIDHIKNKSNYPSSVFIRKAWLYWESEHRTTWMPRQ